MAAQNKQDVYFQLGRYILWFTSSNHLLRESDNIGGQVHTHTVYDLHCSVEGSYYLVTDRRRILVQPGSLVIVAPGVYHSTERDPNCQTVRRISFKLSFLHRLAENPLLPPENGHDADCDMAFAAISHVAVLEDTFSCAAQLRTIREELAQGQFGHYQRVQGLLVSLVVDLVRALQSTGSTPEHQPTLLHDARREKIEEFFNTYAMGSICQEQLAEALHLSPRQLSRILHKFYGMSFKEKLLHTRIAVAKNLLGSTTRSVGDIAELCGYEYESSFTHAFKRCTGMTPLEFRKKRSADSQDGN